MIPNHLVKFLVTKSQFERIKSDASRKGFKTISEYVRHQIFREDTHQIDTTARLIRIENALFDVKQNG